MKRWIFPLLVLCLMIGTASAAANISEYRGVTCKGPLNLLIPLGFENFFPAATSIWIYNFISIGCLFPLAAASGERNTRFFSFLIPLLAAMFVFFGWLQAPDAATTWGIIIGCGLLAGALYMKETLRENWGIGGPGSTLLNIAFYLIILQCVIGIVNGAGIWGSNAAVTPSEYQSVDLTEQVSSVSNTGGFLEAVASFSSILTSMAIGALRVFIQIIASIVLSSAVILAAFPILQESNLAIAFLVAFNLVEWLLFAKLALDFYYFRNAFATEV